MIYATPDGMPTCRDVAHKLYLELVEDQKKTLNEIRDKIAVASKKLAELRKDEEIVMHLIAVMERK